MQNIKDALLREVKAAVELKRMSDAMEACGYNDNPFFNNYALVADGIFYMIGEEPEEKFEDSVTYLALNAPYLTCERRVELLYAEYKRNYPEKTAPQASPFQDDGVTST